MNYFVVFAALALGIFGALSHFAENAGRPGVDRITAQKIGLPVVAVSPRPDVMSRQPPGMHAHGGKIDLLIDTATPPLALTASDPRRHVSGPATIRDAITIRTANDNAGAGRFGNLPEAAFLNELRRLEAVRGGRNPGQ